MDLATMLSGDKRPTTGAAMTSAGGVGEGASSQPHQPTTVVSPSSATQSQHQQQQQPPHQVSHTAPSQQQQPAATSLHPPLPNSPPPSSPPSSKRLRRSTSSPSVPPSSAYTDLQRAVHNALENKTHALSTADKVALALEVLRARQLELDLAQARSNIHALVTGPGTAARTLRAVVPATTVRGLPVGAPVEIRDGRFLLSPTTNDPQALFLTLELRKWGSETEQAAETQDRSMVERNDNAELG